MSDPSSEPTARFESIKGVNPYGGEYWSARDLMPLLGYDQWRHFEDAIERSKVACEIAGQTVADHFAGGGKMITAGKGARREVQDYLLSRIACYLIAMNGDPRKAEIASAQAYFAVQTRRMEELEGELTDMQKRLLIRQRVVSSNKKLSEAAAAAGVNTRSFGLFHDAGYRGLYGGLGVQDIKERKGIAKREEIRTT